MKSSRKFAVGRGDSGSRRHAHSDPNFFSVYGTFWMNLEINRAFNGKASLLRGILDPGNWLCYPENIITWLKILAKSFEDEVITCRCRREFRGMLCEMSRSLTESTSSKSFVKFGQPLTRSTLSLGHCISVTIKWQMSLTFTSKIAMCSNVHKLYKQDVSPSESKWSPWSIDRNVTFGYFITNISSFISLTCRFSRDCATFFSSWFLMSRVICRQNIF